MIKILSACILLLTFYSCSSVTKLSPTSLKKNERLIVLRLVHTNEKSDWSPSTTVMYRLDGKKAPIHGSPFAAKREEHHLRYVIVPDSTKTFGLDDIVFGYSGYAYHANKFGEKALSEVQLPAGNNPVYVGSIFVLSGKKNWDNKAVNLISTTQEVRSVEIKNEIELVQKHLLQLGIKAKLEQALLVNPFQRK